MPEKIKTTTIVKHNKYLKTYGWPTGVGFSLILVLLFLTLNALGQDINRSSVKNLGSAIHKNKEVYLPKEARLSYGVYTIKSKYNNQFMNVLGNKYYNEKYLDGQLIGLATNKQNDNPDKLVHKWYINYVLSQNGINYYQIKNAYSGMLISAPSGIKEDTIVSQQRILNNDEDRSLWQIKTSKNNAGVQIINKQTAKALAVPLKAHNQPTQIALGQRLVMEEVTSHISTLWLIEQIEPVSYRDDAVVEFFERNLRSQGSVSFDQGNSIPLSWGPNKGKVLWVTQDAWDGTQLLPNKKFGCKDFFRYRNSMLLQPALKDWNPKHTVNITKTDSKQQKPRQICDLISGSEYSWPSAGIEIGNKVYVICGEGDGLGPNKQQSLYQLTEDITTTWKVKRFLPDALKGASRINYMAGMVKRPDGYVYVFGFEPKEFGYKTHLYVARFSVTDPLTWTFWDGSHWNNKPVTGERATIAKGRGTMHVAYVKEHFVLMTMDQGFDCDSARSIYMATSSSPVGSFRNFTKVYTISEYFQGKYARYYTPVIHPEFDNGREELLVTYCLNFSACGLPECVDGYQDPYYYRIKGVRVPYKIIGL